jgi:hypothetical protein
MRAKRSASALVSRAPLSQSGAGGIMEIHHKVKPLHGWREFMGEVGIIVLGVLIALGGEQVAEWIHWHHRVEAGRDALSEDFVGLVYAADERALYAPCIAQRLDRIGAVIDQAAQSGRLPPLGRIEPPSRRSWHLVSWDSLAAAQVSTHFPRGDLLTYGNIADFGNAIDRINEDELHAWTVLSMIAGKGRRLSDEEAVQLRMALGDARLRNRMMDLTAGQMKAMVTASGLPLPPADMRDVRAELARRKRRGCAIWGPAPQS